MFATLLLAAALLQQTEPSTPAPAAPAPAAPAPAAPAPATPAPGTPAAKPPAPANTPAASPALKDSAPSQSVPDSKQAGDVQAINKGKLPSGVEYEDMTVGTGLVAQPGAAVVMHYRGTLKATGAEFDASAKRGEPLAAPLTNLIKGWQEGVPGMKVGGKRKLTIPAALAYGAREIKDGERIIIPKDSDLVFEIELVNTLHSEDLVVGTGKTCPPNATVKLHYTGTLKSDGSKFDSSVGGPPAEFPLSDLIRGWQYGVPGMKVGGKRKLTIPWQFGYGERGSPPKIPGKSDLVFEIELVDVK